MHKKVFLTGCTGEVGSRLTLLLLDLGYEVYGVSGSKKCLIADQKHRCAQINLLDPSLDLMLQEIKPEILIHTSWLTTPKEFWNSDQNGDWVTASKRLINKFLFSGGKYLVVTGSCAEYSWNTSKPLTENSLEVPVNTYGNAKLELLNWIRNQEIPFLWTRTFFQFGMKESPGRLIPDIIDLLGRNQEFVVRSSLDVRDFVFVKDVSRVLSLLISQSQLGVVNIGRGEGINVGEFARSVGELLGRKDLIKFDGFDIQKSSVISNPEKLLTMLGDFRWTPLESALIETIKARSI
jgi:nucleoside-diphosphate-sugar epimerase